MNETRAITICVDYHDILALTLPYNISQFQSVTVVTTPDDLRTIAVAQEHGADVFLTEVFYEKNAIFNKFAAIEQGLNYMGRTGWLCVTDADIVIPKTRHKWMKRIGKLYVPHRLIHPVIPDTLPTEPQWGKSRQHRGGFSGHCQIFHADDPALKNATNWHPLDWTWAAGGDGYFERHWNPMNHARPPFRVLHIGETGKNWAGRVTPFADGTIHEKSEYRRGIFQSMMNQRKIHLLYEVIQ